MIRKFKSLGLALVAVLAMSAVVASAAQAAPLFTSTAYPATATGTNTAGNETFTTAGGTVQCDSHFLIGKVGGGDIPEGGANQVTVTPNYENCVAFGFLNAPIHENGCDYVFTATKKVNVTTYEHHVKLVCPQGSPGIQITASTCEVDITPPGNESLTTVTTTNLANGTVTVVPNVGNITANVTKDGIGCPFPGTGHTLGTYHGHVIIDRVGEGGVSISGE